jgi:hypothetical protein
VTDFGDFVNKDHDFSLKDFSGISKVSDITESINTDDFFAWDDDVDEFRVLDDFGDDLSAGLSKSDGQKASNFDDKVLEGIRFSLLTLVLKKSLLNGLNAEFFFLDLLDSLERIKGNFPNSFEHIFQGL